MKTTFRLMVAGATLSLIQPLALLAQNNISPAAGSTMLPSQPRAEGFIMIDGRVHKLEGQVARPVEQDLFLRVTPNGIIGFDEVPRIIPNNSMMRLDGQVVAAPADLLVPPPDVVEAATLPDPRLAPGTVAYGTNTSGLAPSRVIVENPGPRYVSAKKSSATKSGQSRKTSVKKSSTTKRTAAAKKKAPAAKVAEPMFRPFNDAVMPLPDVTLDEDGTISPTIDATSTMLYMTTAKDATWTPEGETDSIRASLGTTTQEDEPATSAESSETPESSESPEPPDTRN